jgi:Tfp pilus assembly protein PilF
MNRFLPTSLTLGCLLPVAFCLLTAGCMGPPKVESGASPAEPAADTTELPPAQTVRLCLTTARLLDKNNDVVGAIMQYERVLKHDPQNSEAARRLAVLYDRCSPPDFAKADYYYRASAKQHPHDADLFNDWGYSLYMRNRWQEAEQKLRQALEFDPNNNRARCNLGLALGQQERYQEAYETFRATGASEAEAHSNLAFVYWTKGKLGEARRECQIARQLNPSCRQTQLMLAKLDDAGGDRSLAKGRRPRSPEREGRPSGVPRPARFEEYPSEARYERGPTRAPQPRAGETPDAEGPQPVYTSPQGTKWYPVPQAKKAPAAGEERAPGKAAGTPATVVFDDNAENGGGAATPGGPGN